MKTSHWMRISSTSALIPVTLLLLAALLGTAMPALTQTNPARIRLAHFSVDASSIDLYIDGEVSNVQGLNFGDITDWYHLPSGTYEMVITAAGIAPDENTLARSELTVDSSQWITLTVIGLVERDTVRFHRLLENASEIATGESRLSVFHAVQGIPAVDVLMNNNPLFQFVNYPGSFLDSNGNPNDGRVTVDLIANVYQIQFVRNSNPEIILLDLDEMRLLPDTAYLIAFIGTPSNPIYSLAITSFDDVRDTTLEDLRTSTIPTRRSSAYLRIAHFSSGTPLVDVYIDGEASSVQRLGFAQVSNFIELTAGTREITLTPAGLAPGDAVIDPVEVALHPGTWSTAAIIGTLSNDSVRVQLFEERQSELPDGETRLSVFQAIPGIEPVNVRIIGGPEIIRFLGYPGSQGSNTGFASVDVIAGSYTIQVISAANPNRVIAELPEINFFTGRNYLLATLLADPPYLLTFTPVTPEDIERFDEAPEEAERPNYIPRGPEIAL
jgi:hypothetical protein